jgi:hypothetical protein
MSLLYTLVAENAENIHGYGNATSCAVLMNQKVSLRSENGCWAMNRLKTCHNVLKHTRKDM